MTRYIFFLKTQHQTYADISNIQILLNIDILQHLKGLMT